MSRQVFSIFRNGAKRYDRKKVTAVVLIAGLAASVSVPKLSTLERAQTKTETQYSCGNQMCGVNFLKQQEVKKNLFLYNFGDMEEKNTGRERTSDSLGADAWDWEQTSVLENPGIPGSFSISTASTEQENMEYVTGENAELKEQQQENALLSNIETETKKTNKKVVKLSKKEKERKEECIKLSEQDRKVLLRIVEAEATGENIKGKMLVANVVLNRVNCKNEFPDTVTDVVFDHANGVCQFSPIDDGRYWSVSISNSTREAVHRVLSGEDVSRGALYFMARRYADHDNVVWFDSSLRYLFSYGEHDFFKYR